MAPEIYPLTLDSLATASKSGDIRWKKCMYNSTPHSLGPGILSLAHARRTLWISSIITSLTKISFSCLLNQPRHVVDEIQLSLCWEVFGYEKTLKMVKGGHINVWLSSMNIIPIIADAPNWIFAPPDGDKSVRKLRVLIPSCNPRSLTFKAPSLFL